MKALLTSLTLLVSLHVCDAAPIPPIKSKLIKGEVVSYVWIQGHKMKIQIDGVPLSGAETKDIYFLVLKNHNLKDQVAKNLTDYARHTSMVSKNILQGMELKKDEMLVMVYRSYLKKLKKGAKIEVIDYEIGGDEFGNSAISRSFKVDGEIVK